MNPELAEWSSGISLGWALFSLAVGAGIVAVVGWRLWREIRQKENDGEEAER